ncbi:hypothetical protein [Aquimarina aquimarini]|uniref:hypothetical protein n=1 Tax=Aquimarina aquimarini TaxID=1191734 RepID=UPI000D55E268|nr:hypothetical protein [Aquimarina aquimarini]
MQRDKISFGSIKSELEDYMTTVIYLNGINFKNIIEEIEVKQFKQKGLHIQNGCYEGISFFIAFHNQNHFLCETLHDYIYQDQRYTLYDYKYSGIPGDHSLTCKISIGAKDIYWYDFKNFSKIIPFEINYKDLEFHFCKEQYCEAINLVRNNTEENMFA